MIHPSPPPTKSIMPVPKLLGLVALLVVTLVFYQRIFVFLRAPDNNPWVIAAIALLWGVLGIWFLFWIVSSIVELFPLRARQAIMPWVFVGPALLGVTYYLLLPTFRTFYFSFLDRNSSQFVGLDNYIYSFTSPSMLESFWNNLLWLVFGGGLSVLLGLLIAALADRTHPIFETVIKSLVFLPMAVSMIAASAVWKLIYAYNPGDQQIGLLNAIYMSFGGSPQPWMSLRGLNTFLLIIVLIWMQTGFALVVFSAAIKGIPSELHEAARIDGANELQSFFKITVPYIRGTIISISTTIMIGTLKVFDIVQAMTGGNFGTQIIANEQYVQTFRSFDYGKGSAVAMVLLLAVLPVVYFNIRDFNKDAKF